ncbi:hypothetical protein [Nocardia gamkensis]|uniref:Uncharacterized protein n=1 Tax=Nocardia gamkensis TaxID=352869 RepID=A0A7X6R3R6_9NOCA|nr:hypothetical protein [Nocardia gamkensis]NKY27744.1 hypothetical protein [Nocardia gamkensis]NQE67381.1 hypothetical protein [Nocardia gamkensis]
MPETSAEHSIFCSSTPDKPLAFTVPPVEATPEQPLPDVSSFLRVCARVEEPTTVLLRCARGLVGEWRHVHEHGRNAEASVDEQLNLLIWLIDREAGGHLKDIASQADAPLSPSTYGQWVAWLVWKYVLYALRQNDPQHHERDAAELSWCIEAFDELVAAARDARLPKDQGPERGGTEFPPRRVWPDEDGSA